MQSHDDLDAAFPLSIGAVFGGPEESPWREPVLRLTSRVITLRVGVTSPLNVNVVYHVPGNVLVPEFVGVRTGSFRRKGSHLMVQVALPVDVPAEPSSYLSETFTRVLEAVQTWNGRKDRRFDLSALESLIETVQRDGRASDAKAR